jgi:acyl-CoA synthetase (AMP-forming)/AMP-acid ligase II
VHASVRLATPFVPISSLSTPFELKHALNLSKATRLFVDEKFLTTILPVATELGMDPNHIYLLRGNSNGRKSFWSIIKDVRNKKISRVDVRTATKDTLAYLVFSSGTTGLPKGNESIHFLPCSNSTDTLISAVMISHGNIIFTFAQMIVLREAGPVVKVNSPCKL